jgi:hypothetical protein
VSKASLIVVASHIQKDRMMHTADLFEDWKVLIEEPITFSGELTEGATLVTVCEKTKAAVEFSGEYRVIAVFQPFTVDGAWCDRSVVMVSTGHAFCKFADILEKFNYFGVMPRKFPTEPIPA